ncbi:Saccharopine dehydrogenase, NADP-dependent [Pustulibacterium marinum]|uniref:Saccharopine dehydrogenase, NADP-dependent n=1 Tax=Pustulibacterium marinum TaxID=1224947 RepID=A0A1I7EY48_9FLAO|nr:saccharopine dehydrogenase family protein [Pustulibacterium marinum]SFU28863.1 Saccharopine dehydrogenase, NADP-dependent [Pustulibacterium marinum]
MRNIVIFGAGKSTAYLLNYFVVHAVDQLLHIQVIDRDFRSIPETIKESKHVTLIKLDIFQIEDVQKYISNSAIVVSMLPARLHIHIAKLCVTHKRHLVTASYISDEMMALDAAVKENGLVFMNEIGLDPGLDHMSAMREIDSIRDNGGKMLLFESFCGGLVAPESDTNLWNYKFTWNPRNVVLAGQGGAAKFIQEGTYKYIPYHKLFRRTEFLQIKDYGSFEAYANRDSLKYRSVYGLDDVLTLYRGTMRRVGFSRAWNLFVQLGLTDDSFQIENSEGMSYRNFLNLFLAYSPTDSVELKLRHYLKIDQDDIVWQKLVELGLFDDFRKIKTQSGTPAQILQEILEASWSLASHDKDMIVMYHKFGYEKDGEKAQLDTSMVVIGENQTYTAMAKTVGLPVAIATLLILNKKITTPGVQLPIHKEVYSKVLEELEDHNILFTTQKTAYMGYNPDNVFG